MSSDEIRKIPAIAKNFIFMNFIVRRSNSRGVSDIATDYRKVWVPIVSFFVMSL